MLSQPPPVRDVTPERSEPRRVLARAGLAVVILVVLTVTALRAFTPATVAPADSPPTAFSAARALPHLEVIAGRPHPVGSTENAAVRDYIVNEIRRVGLQPELQRAVGFRPEHGAIAYVENVLTRLPGTDSTRAVLVVGHYDSVPGAPGAGDNGIAIAAMLETMRALRAGPALRNDVIFLFDDGEEAGLFGASAFIDEHPWARDVGLVFDFDADGPTGRTILGWTSPGDSWLVQELANAMPTLLVSSAGVGEKRLRNNNDLHAFVAAGFAGAHFDTVGGSTLYHSPRDEVARLDPRSLQDRGDVMLAVASHFGQVTLRTDEAGDLVYSSALGRLIVSYPQGWSLPLALGGLASAAVACAVGVRRRAMRVRELALAMLELAVASSGLAVLAQLGWLPIMATHREAQVLSERDFYGRAEALAGVYAIAIAIMLAAWPQLTRRLGTLNVTGAAVVALGLLGVLFAAAERDSSAAAVAAALVAGPALIALAAVPREGGRLGTVLRGVAVLLIALAASSAVTPALAAAAIDGHEEGPALLVALLVLLVWLLGPYVEAILEVGARWVPAATALPG